MKMNPSILSVPFLFAVLLLTPLASKADDCPNTTVDTTLPKPVFTSVVAGSTAVSGNVKSRSGGIQICIDGAPDGSPQRIRPDGTFTSAVTQLQPGQKVVAQFVSVTGEEAHFGPASDEFTVGGATGAGASGLSKAILIGGIEEGAYSSLGQNTNPFINAFIEGPDGRITGWGRVRLLSAPQPSTQGIVSTFTDPTGQLTTQDYSKVGQALDFAVGPRVGLSKHWSFIAAFGVTTPLSSQTVAVTYTAPPPGSVECTTLTNRFTLKNGYAPGLTMAPAGSSTCLTGGFTDIAFSNRDRSNFLVKYGAGFRTSNKFDDCKDAASGTTCTPSFGVLDLTVGQDEAITRGLLRHFVFKMDGILPIRTGSAAYVYLFGSAYIRLAKNQDLSPLILQSASGVTIPSPTVIVLPLQIPDRDYYRLGVGLNINQIFCKMFNSTCAKPAAPAAPSAKSTL
jgi:hypothetical protein